MPMRREAYPDDWEQIALAIKEAAGWRCADCGIRNAAATRRARNVAAGGTELL